MAKPATYFEDNSGKPHKNPDDALIADISIALGKVGDGDDMSIGIARKIIAQRDKIEGAFKDFDALTSAYDRTAPDAGR